MGGSASQGFRVDTLALRVVGTQQRGVVQNQRAHPAQVVHEPEHEGPDSQDHDQGDGYVDDAIHPTHVGGAFDQGLGDDLHQPGCIGVVAGGIHADGQSTLQNLAGGQDPVAGPARPRSVAAGQLAVVHQSRS